MELNEKNKAQVRSWLYEIFAQLERFDDVKGIRDTDGNEVTIKLTFKNLPQTSRCQSLENEIANLRGKK